MRFEKRTSTYSQTAHSIFVHASGANNLNLDSLFITEGVHRSEYKDENELENLLKRYNVTTKYFQLNLSW